MLVDAREGSVSPDYFAFYLKTDTGTHSSDSVTAEGNEIHLEAPTPGFVYVGTLKKFGGTPLRVEVHDREPAEPEAKWQHAVEVSIAGDANIRVVHWPGEEAFSVPTPSGPLRLRVKWAGLDPELLGEGLREDLTSDEHLEIQVWPAGQAPRRVLRWWSEWHLPPPAPSAPDGRPQIEGTDEVVLRIAGRMRPLPFMFASMLSAPEMPGGGPARCTLIWGNVADGTWWVDGYAERRILRPASDNEVRALLPHAKEMPALGVGHSADPRWSAMLSRIGLGDS